MLVDRLAQTTKKMIAKFGDDITISKVVDGVYDPLTGSTNPTVSNIDTKAVQSSNLSKLANNQSYGDVSAKYIVAMTPELQGIDNSWELNGSSIRRIDKTSLQNGVVMLEIYIG